MTIVDYVVIDDKEKAAERLRAGRGAVGSKRDEKTRDQKAKR